MAAIELGWDKENKGVPIIWKNKGINEIGVRSDTKEEVIKIDPRYFRPTEVDELLGDSTKARKKLNWQPKISIEELIKEMIAEDSKESKKESILKNKGFSIYTSKE